MESIVSQQTRMPAAKADNDFAVLEERLQLLTQLRELSAIRCQRFTDMLEAELTASTRQEEEEASEDEDFYWSCPGSQKSSDLDSDSSCSSLSFPAAAYYSQSQPRRSRTHRQRRTSRRSFS